MFFYPGKLLQLLHSVKNLIDRERSLNRKLIFSECKESYDLKKAVFISNDCFKNTKPT